MKKPKENIIWNWMRKKLLPHIHSALLGILIAWGHAQAQGPSDEQKITSLRSTMEKLVERNQKLTTEKTLADLTTKEEKEKNAEMTAQLHKQNETVIKPLLDSAIAEFPDLEIPQNLFDNRGLLTSEGFEWIQKHQLPTALHSRIKQLEIDIERHKQHPPTSPKETALVFAVYAALSLILMGLVIWFLIWMTRSVVSWVTRWTITKSTFVYEKTLDTFLGMAKLLDRIVDAMHPNNDPWPIPGWKNISWYCRGIRAQALWNKTLLRTGLSCIEWYHVVGFQEWRGQYVITIRKVKERWAEEFTFTLDKSEWEKEKIEQERSQRSMLIRDGDRQIKIQGLVIGEIEPFQPQTPPPFPTPPSITPSPLTSPPPWPEPPQESLEEPRTQETELLPPAPHNSIKMRGK